MKMCSQVLQKKTTVIYFLNLQHLRISSRLNDLMNYCMHLNVSGMKHYISGMDYIMEFKFSDYVPSIDQIFQIILFIVRAVYTFEHVNYISYIY